MKRYLIFCCCRNCLRKEMNDLIDHSNIDKIGFTEQTVYIGDSEYRFYSDINANKEKLYGMLFTDYRTCGNYKLELQLVAILESHKEVI